MDVGGGGGGGGGIENKAYGGSGVISRDESERPVAQTPRCVGQGRGRGPPAGSILTVWIPFSSLY